MSEDRFYEAGQTGTRLHDTLVIDAHAHLGRFGEFPIIDTTIDSIMRVMDGIGIDVVAVSSIPGCIGGLSQLGNDQVLDAVRRYPGRVFGYMSVNPRYPAAAAAELRRGLEGGARGIKVHSQLGTPYDDPAYDLVWEFAEEHRLPVLAHTWGAHTGGRELIALEPYFARYPGVNWILAHGGSVEREEYVATALRHPNVYVDTVYSPAPRGLIEYFVREGLEDRLLWGSDMAFMAAAPQIGRVLFAAITEQQKAKILGLNAAAALRLHLPCPAATPCP